VASASHKHDPGGIERDDCPEAACCLDACVHHAAWTARSDACRHDDAPVLREHLDVSGDSRAKTALAGADHLTARTWLEARACADRSGFREKRARNAVIA
jgi:hypothetical protein